MAFFHKIDCSTGESIKINLDKVVWVKRSVTGDGRKILIIELTDVPSIHLIEGEHIESVDKEYNRFPS